MIQGHGGNRQKLADRLGCAMDEIIDMSSNLNPLGPPDYIHKIIRDKMAAIHSLPEPDGAGMARGFAGFHGIDPACVLPGNGTTFFIYTLPQALNPSKVLILGPTYADYQDACSASGIPYALCLTREEENFSPDLQRLSDMAAEAGLVFICNPNNPTGALIEKNDLLDLITAHPETVFVVDESYLPFVDHARDYSLVTETHIPNLLVLSSMSKIFRIPGLRTGFVSGPPELIRRAAAHYQPWSVNSLAQEVIREIFRDPGRIEPFYEETRSFIRAEKARFLEAVKPLSGIRLFEAPTYFILARLEDQRSEDFCARVGEDRLLIRDCANFNGLTDRFVRFSLKTREVNQALSQSIAKALARG